MIEEIVVQTVETPTLIVVKRAVYIGELGGNTRMIFSFLMRILDEEHLIYQTKQGICQPLVFLRFFLSVEIVYNFGLIVYDLF